MTQAARWGRLTEIGASPPMSRSPAIFIGYSGLPGSSGDRAKMIEAIKQGLPVDNLDWLRKELDVPAETLIQTIQIASRTLARRRKEGRLHPDESERLLRIGLLYERARQVLGSDERARAWFKTPKRALGGSTPLEYADTEPGAREVEDLLGRIEHGVFS